MSVNDSAELAALAVEFVQSLDNVPHQVSHMLKEIEHKDVKCQELVPRIAERELQYRKLINSLPPGPWNINGSGGGGTNSESQQTITETLERADKIAEKISIDYSRLEEWSAQKASLSQKLWSVLHAHHTRLQSELARVDPKVIANVPVPQPIPGLLPPPSLAALSSSSTISSAAATVAAATAASTPTARSSTNKGGTGSVRHSTPITSALASLSNSAMSSSAPMERGDGEEKDETLYCFCRQVSFGEMIGCDSETCKYEWFHIGCVGVSKPLPVTWYCEDCLKQMGNNSQNKKRKRQ